MLRKIAGPWTVYSGSTIGATRAYPLEPSEGGAAIRSLAYEIRVLNAGSANVKLGLRLRHGPDRTVFSAHSAPIATAVLPSNPPAVLHGDAGSAIIGEVIQVFIDVDSAANGETWAVIEVYENRKPF